MKREIPKELKKLETEIEINKEKSKTKIKEVLKKKYY